VDDSEKIPEYDDEVLRQIQFRYNGIYAHAAIQFNYTTYDVCRAQDSVKPHSDHADIMVLSYEDDKKGIPHPFWYGRVQGIYHIRVMPFDIEGVAQLKEETRMDFLWVRWFGMEPLKSHKSGFKYQHLDRVGFLDNDNPEAFGFVDPKEVIRGCHLIPAFDWKRTEAFIGPSVARDDGGIGNHTMFQGKCSYFSKLEDMMS
jgi:hypothetical protein